MAKRVLLKLSGEALEGDGSPLEPETLCRVANEIKEASVGAQIGVVIGGGNLFRGLSGAAKGMDRTAADTMGMLATLMNCIALQDALQQADQPATLLSAIPVQQICEPFSRRRTLELLNKGEVVLFAGGTGNPYFTTDTAAALRGLEIDAEVMLKATKVDGVYDKDPARHPDAKRFDTISYDEVLERQLGVMDLTAITLCRDNNLPLLVFDMTQPGTITKVISGQGHATWVGPRKS
ncbi:MAG: UMP kinase [Deltaproteobacteria bacterium]|nr:UMP kinase [Deltaproteobacteria bacterium]